MLEFIEVLEITAVISIAGVKIRTQIDLKQSLY